MQRSVNPDHHPSGWKRMKLRSAVARTLTKSGWSRTVRAMLPSRCTPALNARKSSGVASSSNRRISTARSSVADVAARSAITLATPTPTTSTTAPAPAPSASRSDDDADDDDADDDKGGGSSDDRSSVSDDDGDGDDHDLARDLVAAGVIQPLGDIVRSLAAAVPGRVVGVRLDRVDDRWIYAFRLVTPDGRRIRVEVDAASGAIRKGDD